MAKLVRKTQKIFASGSAQNQVTSFGSIKAGAVDYTKDVADIQTEAFEGGWSSAVQDDYAPYRQDRNAVDFVTTSQLAYVFQEGLPEYDANTTYYKGSWVKGNDGDAFSIYESLSDDNIGNALSDEEKWEKKSFGGGLEIGDIGFAPLGIDEAQNKRRYLNGQVISQTQFVSFTNKIKNAIQLNPSLATSETNWQAEVTNSPYGICGKFVIDDTLGTIRLPKYPDWSIRQVGQAPVIGNGNDIYWRFSKSTTNNKAFTAGTVTGAHDGIIYQIDTGANIGLTTDSTKSNVIADLVNANTEDKLQGKWFIQVATGVEESVDVTREIELNNPFFLGMSQYFESEPNNASWLISNGSFHSGATYVSFYEWLLKIYNGTETVDGVSVKASTDTYDDYDYVINTADETFRLPLLDGSESLPGDKYINLTLDVSESAYTAPANGWFVLQKNGTTAGQYIRLQNLDNRIGWNVFIHNTTGEGVASCPCRKGDSVTVSYNAAGTTPYFRFVYAKGSGSLYFYVGETIQDANVVNASGVLTRVAELSDSYISGLGMPDYSAGISGSLPYTAPSNGELYISLGSSGQSTSDFSVNGNLVYNIVQSGSYNSSCGLIFRLHSGDVVSRTSGSTFNLDIYFYPYKE